MVLDRHIRVVGLKCVFGITLLMIHLRYVDFHDFVINAVFMVVALNLQTPTIIVMKFYRQEKSAQPLYEAISKCMFYYILYKWKPMQGKMLFVYIFW